MSRKTSSSAPWASYAAASSTGSPASRRPAKLTPLTTRPPSTSRHGITRVATVTPCTRPPSRDVVPEARKPAARWLRGAQGARGASPGLAESRRRDTATAPGAPYAAFGPAAAAASLRASRPDSRLVGDGLDLDEHPGVHERGDADHRRGGHGLTERGAVRQAVLLPPRYVGDVHPGPHHVGQAHAEPFQRLRHVGDRLRGLRTRVALVHEHPVRHGGAAGHEHEVTRRNRPAVPDHRLPRGPRRDLPGHDFTASSASSRVNAPAYSALPTMAPSTPSGASAASARRSSRLDTPPLAITGRPVPAHTRRSRSRLGPARVPSLVTSVTTNRRQPSRSSRASASSRSPPSRVQPRAASRLPRTSRPTATCSPCSAMMPRTQPGRSSAAVPTLTRAQPVPSAAPSDASSRIPPDSSTAMSSRLTTPASSTALDPRPKAASRSTRWIHSAPAACQASAAASGSP